MDKNIKKNIGKLIRGNQVINKANLLNNKTVDKILYGIIGYNSNINEWEYINKKVKNKTKSGLCCRDELSENFETIIVMLESPHKDEYDRDRNPIRPLVNDNLFYDMFPSELAKSNKIKLNSNIKYQILLMNAIPLQCSLGLPTEYCRDLVFLYYWEKLFKRLENLLLDICHNNKVCAILNLCTKGGHEKKIF